MFLKIENSEGLTIFTFIFLLPRYKAPIIVLKNEEIGSLLRAHHLLLSQVCAHL